MTATITQRKNIAKLSGVPSLSEVSDEVVVQRATDGESAAMRCMLSDAMEPLLKRGEFYCFRGRRNGLEQPRNGDVVMAFITTQNDDGDLETWKEDLAVVRRYYKDPETKIITLRAENAQIGDITGLDMDDIPELNEMHYTGPAFGITVGAILKTENIDGLRQVRSVFSVANVRMSSSVQVLA